MQKVVINTCFGDFGLSDEALKRLGVEYFHIVDDRGRDNPELVEVVEQMGDAACKEIGWDVDWEKLYRSRSY